MEEGDEFAELGAGINILTEVVRRRVGELEESYQKLSEEQARLIASINSLSTGFIIFDADKKIVVANEPASLILGLEKNQLSFEAINGRLSSVSLEDTFSRAVKLKQTSDFRDVPLLNKYLRIVLTPVVLQEKGSGPDLNHEHIIGAVAAIEDITEQRNLDQSKKDFISIASHEMRTPLTIIKGDLELIRSSPSILEAPKNIREFADDAYENTERLFRILGDFLDVVNLERGKFEFKKEKVDLVSLIKEVMYELNNLAVSKRLYLKFVDSKEWNAIVSADKAYTRQIMINLINNALHYTNEGGITLRIESSGKNKKVYVEDTGIGIPADKQSMLFKKFSTVSRTFVQTKEYGSGLGLYISRLLAESMGGEVRLEKSEPGKGSVFSLTLPSE